MTQPDPCAGFRRERHPGFELWVDAPEDATSSFAQSVVRGLSDRPRWLHCRYLYDAAGSEIFERICEQPEYYQTRTEAALLAGHAATLRRLVPATTLVELGSGSSVKTRHLLSAWTAGGERARYVPVDVSLEMLAGSCRDLAAAYPRLDVRGIAASYERALPLLRELSPLMLVFLGSTIGNLNPQETADFFDRVSAALAPGDHFLLGIDLVKDVRTLEAAYNDRAGWSAAFTRNLFARMNRELGTTLDLATIEHVAYYDGQLDRIEIYARFRAEAVVALPDLGRRFRLGPGEMVCTEISRKFQVDEMAATVARFGLETVRSFVDPTKAFAVLLLRMRDRRRVTAGREHAAGSHLAAARARTLELVEPLSDDQLLRQHSPIMSPVIWDLGHIANYEEQWSIRALDPSAPVDDVERRRDDVYDPIAHPRPERKDLALPGRADTLAYLQAVRLRTRARLREVSFDPGHPLLAAGYVYKMIAQHEAQHAETILQTIQLIDDLVYEPGRRREPATAAVSRDAEVAIVPAGPFLMGTDDRSLAYDNERPAHWVEVPRFRIDLAPVTTAQYLAFVEDGGYRRRALWDDDGWLWLAETRVTHPAQWVRNADGTWGERCFGRLVPLVLDRPVVHVSWYEASAYARWAGKRLPTEAEWEKAAAWDLETRVARRYPWGDAPPTDDHANLDQRTFAPASVGAYPRGRSFFGCHQMIGDVWEWTASVFAPYPGFVAFPYREYSELHFDRGYRVLRGGSWATRPLAIRNTFRNWISPSGARSSPASAAPPTPERPLQDPEPSAAALLDALAELPLAVDEATATVREVAEPSYPGGRRPSGIVTLAGDGVAGCGEHVAWTLDAQEDLRGALPARVPRGRWRLGAWADVMAERTPLPYERAALEAAAIDLALRQQHTNLFRLAGAAPPALRYVVSFERRPDPAAEIARLLGASPGLAFKIDADPGWPARVYAALAATGAVAVLDFKGTGRAVDHARAHAALPAALIEDPATDAGPWAAGVRGRISFDAPVRCAADVAGLPLRPAAVNVKPARVGGVREALRTVAACAETGIAVYFGGMFELDVGRRQLHALAALFAPEGPNDVAPIGALPPRPLRLTVDGDAPGFGAS